MQSNTPINFKLSILDFDDNLPSIKMLIEVEIPHPTGKVNYSANDIWFNCNDLDIFLNDLNVDGIESKPYFKCLLKNLSENMQIEILFNNVEDSKMKFYFQCTETDFANSQISISYSTLIDFDSFHHIKNQFNAIDKIW